MGLAGRRLKSGQTWSVFEEGQTRYVLPEHALHTSNGVVQDRVLKYEDAGATVFGDPLGRGPRSCESRYSGASADFRRVMGASSVLCKRPFSLRRRLIWAVEKWESWFWISNFPRPTFKSSLWSFFFFV